MTTFETKNRDKNKMRYKGISSSFFFFKRNQIRSTMNISLQMSQHCHWNLSWKL